MSYEILIPDKVNHTALTVAGISKKNFLTSSFSRISGIDHYQVKNRGPVFYFRSSCAFRISLQF